MSAAGKLWQETEVVGKGHPTICTLSPTHSEKYHSVELSKTKIMGKRTFISHSRATGIVPDWLEYSMTSSGGAGKERLLFVAATVINPEWKYPWVQVPVQP